jgi:hypothetical protein
MNTANSDTGISKSVSFDAEHPRKQTSIATVSASLAAMKWNIISVGKM